MKLSFSTRTLLAAVLLLPAAGLRAADPVPAASQPSTAPAYDPNVVAVVNGQPILKEQFYKGLDAVYGMKMFDEIVQLTVVQQACKAQNITVGQTEVQAERDQVLNNLVNQPLTPQEKESLLARLLQQKNLSQLEFSMLLNRNAGLRALLKGKVQVTDDELKQAFQFNYGERVQVRDAAVSSLADAAHVRSLIVDEKQPFEKVAKEHSINPQAQTSGGLLPPFAANDAGIPKAIRDAAFGLKNPGDITPSSVLMEDGTYHILYLERRIPAKDVKFDDVKAELTKSVTNAKEQQMQNQLLQQLLSQAKLNISDPILVQNYEAQRNAVEDQRRRAAAATQAAPPSPPAP